MVTALALLTTAAAPAQLPTAPDLFDRPPMEIAAASVADPTSPALRSRNVTVNRTLFDALPAGGTGRVQLPLFADREYTAVLQREADTNSQFVGWRGRLEGWGRSQVSAVYRDGIVSMHVSDGEGGEFDLRSVPGGGHRVMESWPGVQGVCEAGSGHGADEVAAATEPGFAAASSGSAVVSPSHPYTYVDILVLYTPNARNAAGGTSEIHAKVWQFINDSNWRFSRSETGVILRAVGIDEFPYDDSAQDLSRHLTNLSTTNNGPESIVKPVLARRDEVGADTVCLLTHGRANSGDTLGIAYRGWPCVVEWSQDTLVFTHEVGHNLGCQHEKGSQGTPDAGYNHGYSHRESWDLGLATEHETRVSIMNSSFSPSQRTDYFSNPNILFTFTGNSCGGLCADVDRPMGDADSADNARYLRENRATTARLRQANFYLDSAIGPGGNATERQPDNNVARVYNTYFPATEIDSTLPAVIRLAPGNYTSAVRITQNSRLEKWGGGAKARIGP